VTAAQYNNAAFHDISCSKLQDAQIMLRTKGKKSSLDSIGSHRWRFAVHRGDMADIICKVCVKYRWKTLNVKNQSIAI